MVGNPGVIPKTSQIATESFSPIVLLNGFNTKLKDNFQKCWAAKL